MTEPRIYLPTNKYRFDTGAELWVIRDLRDLPILTVTSEGKEQGFTLSRKAAAELLRTSRRAGAVTKIQRSTDFNGR